MNTEIVLLDSPDKSGPESPMSVATDSANDENQLCICHPERSRRV